MFSVSENPDLKFQAPIYKNVELHIFCQKTESQVSLYVCFFLFFFSGVTVSTKWSKNVARGLIVTEMKSSSVLFNWQKELEGT